MSTVLKGDIQINADPSRFVQGVQRAEKSLNTLTAGTQKTGQSLQRLTQSTTQSSQAMQRMGQSTQQAAAGAARMTQSANQASQATSRFNAGTIGTAASIGTMGAGLVSLEASMSNYTKATFKVEKAELKVQKSTLAAQKARTMLLNAENMLEKARKSGKKTAEELQYYEEQVINYREDYKLKTDDATLAQEKLNIANMDYADTQKLMASSIATTVLGTLSATAQMMQGVGSSAAASSAKMKLMAVASKLTGGALGTTAAAASKASVSNTAVAATATAAGGGFRVMAAGIKTASVAFVTSPIGAIITGVTVALTALWSAWNSNFMGFRDGIHSIIDSFQGWYDQIKKVFPVLGMLEDALKSIGIDIGLNIDQWQQYEKAERDLQEAVKAGIITTAEQNRVLSELRTQQEYAQKGAEDHAAAEELRAQEADAASLKIEALTQSLGIQINTTDSATAATQNMGTEVQQLDTDVDNLTVAVETDTAAIAELDTGMTTISNTLTTNAIPSIGRYTDAMREMGAATTQVAKTDMQTWREAMANSIADHVNHDRKLAESKEKILSWANTSKIAHDDDEINVADWQQNNASSLQQAVNEIESYGGNAKAILEQNGIDWQSLGITVKGATGEMSSDVTNLGGTVQRTMKSMHQEIAAFEAALKKNDNFVTYTVSDMLRAIRTMSKETQEEYAKIQAAVAHAHSIAQGRGNTGFYDKDGNPVNFAGAVSYNQMVATNNWQNTGQNVQHHGPTGQALERKKLLAEGILTYDDKVWTQGDSRIWQNARKQKGIIAVWDGSKYVKHRSGTDAYNIAKYKTTDPEMLRQKQLMEKVNEKIDLAQSYVGHRKRRGTKRRLEEEVAKLLGVSVETIQAFTDFERKSGGFFISARRGESQMNRGQLEFINKHFGKIFEDLIKKNVDDKIANAVSTTTGGRSSGVFQTSYAAPADRTGTKTITQDMIDYANSQAGQDEYQRHLETLVSKGQWKSEYEGHDVYELRQVIEMNAV